MWDWWFGWHGNDSRRYKLWHPRTSQRTGLTSGGEGRRYVSRTSMIGEYIGSTYAKAAIEFIDRPSWAWTRADSATTSWSVCDWVPPICRWTSGGFVHQVRATGDGAEMRSRFWMGGRQ